MVSPQFSSYKGFGEIQEERYHYSQAVRLGSRVECSGQSGWDPVTGGDIPQDINKQIDQAFRNVDLTLRTAGSKGWTQVVSVKSYHVPMCDEALDAMARNLKQWLPDQKPIWTCIGVPALGMEAMKVEIDVVAWDEEGAK